MGNVRKASNTDELDPTIDAIDESGAYHHPMGTLLEDRDIDDILGYFVAKGVPLTVHTRSPSPPTPDQLRHSSRTVREAMLDDASTHWAALGSVSDHYGGGSSEEDAIRSAARRYRIEQAPPDAGP